VLRSRVVGSSSDGDDQREGDGGALVMATTADFGTLTASLQNPPISRVIVRETVLYIGGTSLVSVVLMWLTPKISIFGVDCLYIVVTYDYWYRLY
jgi:hypothetical protein